MLKIVIVGTKNEMYGYRDIINHVPHTVLSLKRLLSKELETSLSYMNIDKQVLHITIEVKDKT